MKFSEIVQERKKAQSLVENLTESQKELLKFLIEKSNAEIDYKTNLEVICETISKLEDGIADLIVEHVSATKVLDIISKNIIKHGHFKKIITESIKEIENIETGVEVDTVSGFELVVYKLTESAKEQDVEYAEEIINELPVSIIEQIVEDYMGEDETAFLENLKEIDLESYDLDEYETEDMVTVGEFLEKFEDAKSLREAIVKNDGLIFEKQITKEIEKEEKELLESVEELITESKNAEYKNLVLKSIL